MLRWTIVTLLMLAAVINYIDRQTLSVLGPTILKQFQMSSTQYGWIVFSFSLAYMIGAPLTGRFLDRVGVRAGLAMAVAAWSAVAAAHMFARGFPSFCALRAALGLSEAAIFPAGIKGARKILPLAERATGLGLVFSGSALGASLAPLVAVPLALHFGWRWAFFITGASGFAWLAVWWAVARRPGTEGLGPEARESEHEGGRAQGPAPTGSLAGNPMLWGFLIGVFCVGYSISFGFNWLTLYMVKGRNLSLQQVPYVLWIPYISSHFGTIGGGWLSGWLIQSGWSLLEARRAVILWGGLLVLGQAAIPSLPSNWAVLALFSVAGVGNGALYTLYYAYMTDHFPPHRAGLLTGLGTMAYSACATVTGPAIGWTVDHFSYTPVLLVCGLLPMTGALAWYVLGGRGR